MSVFTRIGHSATARDDAADLFFGQQVLVWARWFVIVASAIVAVWRASDIAELTINVLVIGALMGLNFFVHGRALMEKPANRIMVIAISGLDLVLLTLMVLSWQSPRGLDSPFFVFYYPLLAAFALVLRPRFTIPFTVLVALAYVAACLAVNPDLAGDVSAVKTLVLRLISLGAMGGLGTYYWRIRRARMRETADTGGVPKVHALDHQTGSAVA
jgi:hypothetical protein